MVKTFLTYFLTASHAIETRIKSLISTERQVVFLILCLSALTRLPFLFHPTSNISDEFLYSDFAILVSRGIPVFDIHPPLIRMLFSFVLSLYHFTGGLFPIDVTPFGDFPFSELRGFVSLFGILLPLVLYFIGRISSLPPKGALLIGLFAIFDNTLTLYGGTILPDIILLFFSMSALACVLISVKIRSSGVSWFYISFGALLWGLALSIKWTALGMLPVMILIILLLGKQRCIKIVYFLILSILIYFSVFYYYFTLFTPVNRPPETIVEYYTEFVEPIRFPNPADFREITHAIFLTQRQMLQANTDPSVINKINHNVPSPLLWPLGQSATLYWWEPVDHRKTISLMGNFVLWTTLLFIYLYGCVHALRGLLAKRMEYLKSHTFPLILMFGYLINYLPFFFISRPMYLYHYLTSLVFLILLAPHLIPTIQISALHAFHDKLFVKVFSRTLFIAIILSYIISLPVTYGL